MSPEDSDAERAEFVPAVFARSLDEAEMYRELLDDHDIPAVIGSDEDLDEEQARIASRRGMTRGVAVLVPEAMLDEASEIIADRENAEEFEIEPVDEEEDADDEFGFEEEDVDEEADAYFDEDDEDDFFLDLDDGDDGDDGGEDEDEDKAP